ncbi:MAG: hypothetical protein DYH13_04140 [Alphaproteobacteria bacterium PRO2]|nr:hypothetical protein [Alphaproteobacteria bacterium PRO2]
MSFKSIHFLHTVPEVGSFISGKLTEKIGEKNLKISHEVCTRYLEALSAEGEELEDLYRDFSQKIDSILKEEGSAVLVTCSSLGEFIDRYKAGRALPLFRIDEPMMAQAVTMGKKIALVVTNDTTIKPSISLLQRAAATAKADVSITCLQCKEDVGNLANSVDNTQEALIKEKLETIFTPFDVIVLAQVSIGRIFERHSFNPSKPTLKSYESGFVPVLEADF